MLAAFETSTSTGPKASSASLANWVIDRGIGQVEVEADRLPALVPDVGGQLLADLVAAGAQDHGMPGLGQDPGRFGADARRGSGDHGRASLGLGVETSHQLRYRGVTVVGSAARPRTLMECTRTTPSSSMA